MQTVRNRAIDSHRHVRTAKHPPVTELPESGLPDTLTPTTHDELIERDERDALRDLLGQLPEAQAEVIILAFFGEMSHTEIAAQLELPPGTVKGRMRLGMDKLRHAMEAVD